MRILSFGHLPISYGGKQTSGASFVIYQLAKHFNELDNIDSFVCATDIYKETDTSYGITYLGWNKSLIVKKMFKHPYSTFKISDSFEMSIIHLLEVKQLSITS